VVRSVRVLSDVEAIVWSGGIVAKNKIGVPASPVVLAHREKGAATVVGKVKGGEESEEALSQAGGRSGPVIVKWVVEPRGAEDTGVDIRRKIIVVQARRPRIKGFERGERVHDEPVSFR
jgi:hypothetical protein